MIYPTAAGFRMALEQRLPDYARRAGIPLYQARREVAFNRLLARLLEVDRDSWAVKGGMNLAYRFGSRARPTKDIDLAHRSDRAGVEDLIAAAAAEDLGDYCSFRVLRVTDFQESDSAPALVSFFLEFAIAGRRFEDVKVDVGLGERIAVGTEPVAISTVLDFAGMGSFLVPSLPLEEQLAEKLHAYTRRYGVEQRESSRVKDLDDMRIIAAEAVVVARVLSASVRRVFQSRATHEPPEALPPPPPGWAAPFAKLSLDRGGDPDIGHAHEQAAALLDPVLKHQVDSGEWDPAARQWTAKHL